MATRKPRPASKAKTRPARPPRATRPKRAARPTAAKGRAAAAAKPAAKRPAPRREQRRQDPETLRLRTVQPSFTVDDLEASVRFYTDVLGFFVDERWTEGNVLRGVMLRAGTCEFGLSQDDWKKGRDRKKGVGMRLWCTTVQDVDALADRIRRAGGQVAEGPQEESWGGRSLSIVDPDGFQLTIYREAEPAL